MEKNNKSNRNQNLLIAGLFVIIFLMAVGFSGFSQRLKISDSSNVTTNWNIGFDSVTPSTICQGNDTLACGSVMNFTAGDKTLTLGTSLMAPGNTVTYDIAIKNYGDVNAKIATNGITMTPTNVNSVINYSQTGLTAGETVLNAGQTINFTITVTVPSSIASTDKENLTNALTFYVDWVQA